MDSVNIAGVNSGVNEVYNKVIMEKYIKGACQKEKLADIQGFWVGIWGRGKHILFVTCLIKLSL